jgi:hypothetical protein
METKICPTPNRYRSPLFDPIAMFEYMLSQAGMPDPNEIIICFKLFLAKLKQAHFPTGMRKPYPDPPPCSHREKNPTRNADPGSEDHSHLADRGPW